MEKAGVASMVECLVANQVVAGSNPVTRSKGVNMSLQAETLLEEKIGEILEQLYPNMGYVEYCEMENEVFDKIFDDNKAEVFVSKLDQHAHNLALMALDLTTFIDISKIERKEHGERKEEQKEEAGST